MSENTPKTLLDATIVLAAATGMIYLCGYCYYDAFFAAIGVPTDRGSPNTYSVLVRGSVPFWGPVLLLAFAWLVISQALAVMRRREAGSKAKQLADDFDEMASHRGVQVLSLTVMGAVLISGAIHNGRSQAKEFMAGNCPSVEVTYLPQGDTEAKQLSGCLAAMTDAAIWIRPLDAEGKLRDRTVSLPSSSLIETSIGPTLRTLKPSAPPTASPTAG